jgi:hypothetical protein
MRLQGRDERSPVDDPRCSLSTQDDAARSTEDPFIGMHMVASSGGMRSACSLEAVGKK